jgi:signal peptidase II
LSRFLKKSNPGSAHEKKVLFNAATLACLLILIDQASKIAVEHYIGRGQRIPVFSGFFNLTFITNKGAAWGIMHGYGWLLLTIAIVVIIASFFFMRWLTEGWNERYYALFIIISGVIGNSIDRVWRNEVVDFLDFYALDWHWPAFNIADSAICVGVALYFISVFLRPLKEASQINTTPKDRIIT